MTSLAQHLYLSTACLHEAGDPALHEACRQTCKFCGAPCSCPRHPGGAQEVTSWVDQARGIARELLQASLNGPIPPELLHKIADDPALFWLRGEETPPGTWAAG
jgi:hypothetical protein